MHTQTGGWRWIIGAVLGLLALTALAGPAQAAAELQKVTGRVESGGTPLPDYVVTLYRTTSGAAVTLGNASTKANGQFSLGYRLPSDRNSVLYLIARKGPVALATVLGSQAMPAWASTDNPTALGNALASRLPDGVVINERTTVATGYALAQFVNGTNISGNRVGVRNAAAMVGNMVDVTTGEIAPVLGSRPNGSATSTLPTFNSLANMVAGCVASLPNCTKLFAAAPWPDGASPHRTLQAIVNIARNPWRNVPTLAGIAGASGAYQPALAVAPDAWTIALTFRGNGLVNGPGNFAFDAEGNPG